MKWLYFQHAGPQGGGFKTAAGYAHRHAKKRMQRRSWALALEADMISRWELAKKIAKNYDGVIVEYVNWTDREKQPIGLMRAQLIKKYNPDAVIVGIWDCWSPRPLSVFEYEPKGLPNHRSRAVEACDLLIAVENRWEMKSTGRPMFWNDIYKTDKFYCLLSPINMDYLQTFQKSYEEREKHIISCSPVNYQQTKEESAKVLREFMKPPWKAGLTHIRKRVTPEPFYKLGTLPWGEFIEWISKSYMGILNARSGGLGSIASYGAAMKTPFVGSDTVDCIVKCFPDLVREMTDYEGQAALCKRLIDEPKFWREITEKGFRICKEELSFEGARRNLYKLLEERSLI